MRASQGGYRDSVTPQNTQESPNQKALNSAFPSDLKAAIFDQSCRGPLASSVPMHGYEIGSLQEEESRMAVHAQALLPTKWGQDAPARTGLSPALCLCPLLCLLGAGWINLPREALATVAPLICKELMFARKAFWLSDSRKCSWWLKKQAKPSG